MDSKPLPKIPFKEYATSILWLTFIVTVEQIVIYIEHYSMHELESKSKMQVIIVRHQP